MRHDIIKFGVNLRWIKDGKIWKERYMINVVDGNWNLIRSKKYFLLLKMEWTVYTVPRLKQMAKDRGLRGYSKLRKPELLNLLNPPPLPRQNVPRLLDHNDPNINEPVLDTPVPYISTTIVTPSKTTKVQPSKSMAKTFTMLWERKRTNLLIGCLIMFHNLSRSQLMKG